MKIYVSLIGGYGNMLFQYMNALNLSIKYGYELFVLNGNSSKYITFKTHQIQISDIIYKNEIKTIDVIKEPHFYYNTIQINLNQNILLHGYYQSYKYSNDNFINIKNVIMINLLDKYKKIVLLYNNIINKTKITICIHFRLTDYIKYADIHYVIRGEYWYLNSIKLLIKNIKNINNDNIQILLFSDDIEYLKKTNIYKTYDCLICETYGLDTEEIFLLMSLCDHFIIPNSTYSLLAYYFRKNINSKIIIPNKWFGIKGPEYKLEDIIDMTNDNVIISPI